MRFLVLWHRYLGNTNHPLTPGVFVGSLQKVINCRAEDISKKIEEEEDVIKEEFHTEDKRWSGKLSKLLFATHCILLKVHQIIPLADKD